jgi:hypothetical protein
MIQKAIKAMNIRKSGMISQFYHGGGDEGGMSNLIIKNRARQGGTGVLPVVTAGTAVSHRYAVPLKWISRIKNETVPFIPPGGAQEEGQRIRANSLEHGLH